MQVSPLSAWSDGIVDASVGVIALPDVYILGFSNPPSDLYSPQ